MSIGSMSGHISMHATWDVTDTETSYIKLRFLLSNSSIKCKSVLMLIFKGFKGGIFF